MMRILEVLLEFTYVCGRLSYKLNTKSVIGKYVKSETKSLFEFCTYSNKYFVAGIGLTK